METVFYDRNGKAVAYTEDGVHVYMFTGKPVAWIRRDSLFRYNGHHLGWLLDGWVRDNDEACVLFTLDAMGGPPHPEPGPVPEKAEKEGLPVQVPREFLPTRTEPEDSWSIRARDAIEDFFLHENPVRRPSTAETMAAVAG